MKLKIGDYEFSVRRETSQWHTEDEPYVWEYIFRIEWLSPKEKEHRAELVELRKKGVL